MENERISNPAFSYVGPRTSSHSIGSPRPRRLLRQLFDNSIATDACNILAQSSNFVPTNSYPQYTREGLPFSIFEHSFQSLAKYGYGVPSPIPVIECQGRRSGHFMPNTSIPQTSPYGRFKAEEGTSEYAEDRGYTDDDSGFDSLTSMDSLRSSPNSPHLPLSPDSSYGQQIMKCLPVKLHLESPLTKPCMKRKRNDCSTIAESRKRRKEEIVISPLQRDLDAIFMSIRRLFFFNMTSSNLTVSAERDACVQNMQNTSISYSYKNLVLHDDRQDYSLWQVRWGYLFMYLMRHAHLVYHSLKHVRLSTIPPITPTGWNIPFDNSSTDYYFRKFSQPFGILRVCAIGGGPGSDLIGLALFLRANRSNVKISACILDLCGHWRTSWRGLFDHLPPYLAEYFLDVKYVPFDYLAPSLSPEQSRLIASADLITMVKSMSPVASNLFKVKPTRLARSLHPNTMVKRHSVFDILSSVSSGSVVLYIDNKSGKQHKVMTDALKSIQGYSMLHYQITKVQLPKLGFSEKSTEFMKWVGYGPSFSSGRNEIVVMGRS